MKHLTLSLFLLLPLDVNAQMPPGMNQAKMQQMMQQMQSMQNCMKNIDQTEMKAFEQRARKMEAEVKTLCAQGKRDEAQSVAMAFGMEVAKSPSMQQMKKCGEPMRDFLPQMPMLNRDKSENDQSHKHVCDEVN